jgi:drug/metabolite transporter (DMT)-like permease
VITYLNPAVALVLGAVMLGESLSPATAAELLLILAGSWLSTGIAWSGIMQQAVSTWANLRTSRRRWHVRPI